jgi:hypothetical protein
MAQASVNVEHPSALPQTTEETPKNHPLAPLQSPDTPSSDVTEQDTAMEYDSMVLLSKLEQLTIRLSDKMVHTSKTLALKYLFDLTNQVVEFAEHLPVTTKHKLSLTILVAKDVENYTVLRPPYIHDNRLALEDFVDPHRDVIRPPHTFPGLSTDVLRVINIYLSVFVMAFRTPRMSEQWRTLYKGFFVSLTKIVRTIQAGERA